MTKRVVVTGLGTVSSVGSDAESTWKALQDGNSKFEAYESKNTIHQKLAIARAPEFSLDDLVPPKEQARLEPYLKFSIEASRQALEASKLLESGIDMDRVGCAIGVGFGSVDQMVGKSLLLHQRGPRRISPLFIPYNINNMAAGVVANTFGLRGPNTCPSTACTSGAVAIGQSYLYIKAGMADAMVCGGAESAICELSLESFARMRVLAGGKNLSVDSASRPFDQRSSGFVMGEGSGILLLESLDSALARGAKIYGEVTAYSNVIDEEMTNGRFHGNGLYRCMKDALQQSRLELRELDYINAHGNSHPGSDQYEYDSIAKLYRGTSLRPAISSIKGNMGHCLGASGGLDAALTIMSMQNDMITRTLHTEQIHPGIDQDVIVLKNRNKNMHHAMSTSFGLGGSVTALCFAKAS